MEGFKTNLEIQHEYYDHAYRAISTALDFDQADQPLSAVPYYQQGLEILKKGLSINFNSYEWDRAKPLQQKMATYLNLAEDRLKTIELNYSQQNTSTTSRSNDSLWNRMVNNLTSIAFGTPANNSITNNKPNTTAVSYAQANTLSRSAPTNNNNPVTYTNNSGHNNLSHSVNANQSRVNNNNGAVNNNSVNMNVNNAASQQSDSLQVSRALDSLKNIEPRLKEMILNEIIDNGSAVTFDDIVGLDDAKRTLQEAIVYPLLRPDLFTGIRAPPKGILFFGPPGNGKTVLAKAVASSIKAHFFSISASTLASKYVGDGEKLVRALFGIARYIQPSVIFIDEIDSLLSSRKSEEHEASRRLKNEFLLQFDGVATSNNDRVLLLGATNRPDDLDEAMRRRMPKRIYIPLPEDNARSQMILKNLEQVSANLSSADLSVIVHDTRGYSASDIRELVKEAAMFPIRDITQQNQGDITRIAREQLRPVLLNDFKRATQVIKPSVKPESIREFELWNEQFGSYGQARG
jgi:spastin